MKLAQRLIEASNDQGDELKVIEMALGRLKKMTDGFLQLKAKAHTLVGMTGAIRSVEREIWSAENELADLIKTLPTGTAPYKVHDVLTFVDGNKSFRATVTEVEWQLFMNKGGWKYYIQVMEPVKSGKHTYEPGHPADTITFVPSDTGFNFNFPKGNWTLKH